MARFRSENTPASRLSDLQKRSLLPLFIAGSIGYCSVNNPLLAQVTSDDSLGTETSTENNVTEITGGTQAEGNLFHSFQDFSVETGGTAFFNNGTDVSNIVGRVTGSNISNIDGLIRANGDANLILLNPNGVNFGNNAQLDIGGSFLGSTAESVVFEDGNVFNTNLDTQPLLTIATPVGLQLGQNSETIKVSGTGNLDASLSVDPGNTFALVGNGISFDGGVVNVESGRIDLGSVAVGEVGLTGIEAGWQLGYEAVAEFSGLELLGAAALFNPNIAANSTGGIQVRGKDITLERSQIAAQTIGNDFGGDIKINASESLTLMGEAAAGDNASSISNNVAERSAGRGGAIEIVTDKLDIMPRSFIDNSTFGTGNAGNININAVEINLAGAGFSEFQQKYRTDALEGNLEPGSRLTGIFAETGTTGTTGDISLETSSLNLSEGAIIVSSVFTAGNTGEIDVTASDISLDASAIQIGGTIDSLSSGSVGDLNLNSDRLNISNGGTAVNVTLGDVSGGDINIVADSIDLADTPPDTIVRTGLFTNSSLGSGTGGNITIDARTIAINEAAITSNSGAIFPDGNIISTGGTGGNIKIDADENIDMSGIISNPDSPEPSRTAGIGSSTYTSSNGGNLDIDTGTLVIRSGASLASASFGAGDGGKITIDAANNIDLIGFTNERAINPGGIFASSGGLIPSALETTGASGGVKIATPILTVQDNAFIDVRSINTSDAGSIELDTESIFLSNGGTLSATTQDGKGGNIQIDTNEIQLDRGLINASVLGGGTGGNIEIKARDLIQVKGESFAQLQAAFFNSDLLTPDFLANLSVDRVNQGILAATLSTGDAGKIDLQSRKIGITEGGLVATATVGGIGGTVGTGGKAGTIFLNASESLVLDGSLISNNTVFDGQGGDVSIDSPRLEVLGGSQVTVSSLGSGNGGSVLINATESVIVAGNGGGDSVLPSTISVGATPLPQATGDGGNLTINTPEVDIDGGQITIGSTGTGDAGRLQIIGESIKLDNGGSISADTQSGSGGNIVLNANNIIWRGGSFTTATARGEGNGGNIFIEADNLVAFESSRIKADAFVGVGGNIEVDTKGLFLCPSCQVTASSELGLDGVVDIETLEPNTFYSLELAQQTTRSQEEVAVGCAAESNKNTSQLTIVGRGGLPNRPQELLNAQSLIEFPSNTAAVRLLPQITKQPYPLQLEVGIKTRKETWCFLPALTIISVANSAINSADCHN